MSIPVLTKPILLGTAAAGMATSTEQLAAALAGLYIVQELEPVGEPLQAKPPFELQIASAAIGELALVSVQGSAMTIATEPCIPLCMLALPSSGWGRYQLDDISIENRTGQSVTFLPSRGWRLFNDITAGTSVQFSEVALISRMEAMASGLSKGNASRLLSTPFTISMECPQARYHYRQLLTALAMIDYAYQHNNCPPDPMLRLDDLVLRCTAMLMFPITNTLDEQGTKISNSDLRRTVLHLMEWIQANLHRPISLSEIEEYANYGRRALQNGFKSEVGCGPMQWVRKQRLSLAHHKLCNPDLATSVTSVAQACGYINLASFSRDFRERFGLSAGELLRQSRKAHPGRPGS